MIAQAILKHWHEQKKQGHHNSAIARQLNISDAALFAAGCQAPPHSTLQVKRLQLPTNSTAWSSLFSDITPSLVRCVVRNNCAVLERTGHIKHSYTRMPHTVFVQADTFSLALNIAQLSSLFALKEQGRHQPRLSLQGCDAWGNMSFKIYFLGPQAQTLFNSIVIKYIDNNQSVHAPINIIKTSRPIQYPTTLPGNLFACLTIAQQEKITMRIVVNNLGAQQTCTHIPNTLKRSQQAPWLNILDDGLDLHCWEEHLTLCTTTPLQHNIAAGWIHWHAEATPPKLSLYFPEKYADIRDRTLT